ncbi:peroxiredoxin family protein [Frigoriglobus tundricola]|uniref:thioredoxin-dependent peroxiredoxin n=1 Tax=Frigoriglobus tundricola TaxID=2774151 RepID=A0A6M5YIR0_9BACT|nr:peroxiredoxin family protein [Frigoriglobus tundricola]QJW93133.1 Redoxin [Frigoriglobus tundricola]
MNEDRPLATTRRTGPLRSSHPALRALAVCTLAAVGSGCARSESSPLPAPEPAPNVAAEAADYLRAQNADPLSGDLHALLTDPAKKSVPSEAHALRNQPAPTFALTGADDKRVELEGLLARGPVVLVFYYGYSCDHCVAQLFGIDKDLRYFTELGATVVAVSPDAPERTRTRYAEYGKFDFPVLSDPDRAVAGKYGVFRPAAGEFPKWQAHGTFVIGRDRTVRWVNTGTEPFTDNVTLLRELAASDGRLPLAPAKGGTP